MNRIAKVIAAAGVCSRRDAEALIVAGRVSVDGKVIASPALNVSGANVIKVDGKKISAAARPVLYAYNKPAGIVVSHKDERGRPSVFDKLPAEYGRLISIGRLDLNSEGLLLLTNSGEVQRAFETSDVPRVYRVRVRGLAKQSVFDKLAAGCVIEGVRYKPIEVEVEKAGATNSWFRVVLREGKNREIRRVLGHFGFEVSRLIRVSYGDIELGDLKPGEIRIVEKANVSEQKRAERRPHAGQRALRHRSPARRS
ncbi:MAG: rRNA pseudouridine synthase [Alphaproteobacteria bacterium]|nr:rRNA pseudouridine synthase [Alphaproteobacteria bacterium]